ncbi:hypothetical protein KIN34_09210 [Cellulomonas sp. DKR-3]|uniref:Lipoprotein n=1 Tax=Cellulomonas fulva TaxID=2835530 RepID=A0ABS5TZ78_9CELL|nr:hypothetical protein [Cellulomonas fulva]MBT0994463.1 hypothetical protein [Cellulomonas fulva]
MSRSRILTCAAIAGVLTVPLLAACATERPTATVGAAGAPAALSDAPSDAPSDMACGVEPVVVPISSRDDERRPSVEGLATFPAQYVADAVGEYLDGERDDPAWISTAIVDLDGDDRGDLRVFHHGDLTSGVRRVLEGAADRWDVRLEYVPTPVDLDGEAARTILDELLARVDDDVEGSPLGMLGPDDLQSGIEIEVATGALSEEDYCAVAELVDATWPGATTTFRVGQVTEVHKLPAVVPPAED